MTTLCLESVGARNCGQCNLNWFRLGVPDSKLEVAYCNCAWTWILYWKKLRRWRWVNEIHFLIFVINIRCEIMSKLLNRFLAQHLFLTSDTENLHFMCRPPHSVRLKTNYTVKWSGGCLKDTNSQVRTTV